MPPAPGKGLSSSAVSRGLDPQTEAARFLEFNKPNPRSPAIERAANDSSIPRASGAYPIARPNYTSPRSEPISPGTQPTPAQEAARIAQMVNSRRSLPDTLSNMRDGSNYDPSQYAVNDGNNAGDEQLSDSSVPQENAPSVTDVGQLADPYGEDISMRQKMADANRRQAQVTGQQPTTSNSAAQASGNPQAISSAGPATTGGRGSRLERGREAIGQEYGKFQRDLQATKRRDDVANADKLKALAASKGSQTLKQVNMLKERIEKIRDLFSLGTGVGVFYYIGKLDITIANRYFLKRTYLWGYREKEEYEGNKFLRFNDNLDLIEWCGWMFIRVIMTLAPVMILFMWVILPLLAAHELANRILGPTLAGYLMRIIH